MTCCSSTRRMRTHGERGGVPAGRSSAMTCCSSTRRTRTHGERGGGGREREGAGREKQRYDMLQQHSEDAHSR